MNETIEKEDELRYYPINMKLIDTLNSTIIKHPSITMALSMIVPRISRDGVKFVAGDPLDSSDGAAEKDLPVFNENMWRSVNREWNEETTNLVLSLIINGFAVVRKVDSDRNAQFKVPRTLQPCWYTLGFRFDPETSKTDYKAFWRNLDEPSIHTDTSLNKRKNGDEIVDAHIIVMYVPSPYDGSPTSPVASIYPEVLRLALCEDTATWALYHQAHVPYVYSTSDAAAAAAGQQREPGQMPLFSMNDITRSKMLQQDIERRQNRRLVERDNAETQLRQMHQQLAAQYAQSIKMQEQFGNTSSYIPTESAAERYAAAAPFLSSIPLLPGQRLENPPVPTLPAQYTDMVNSIKKTIMSVIGVNPQLAGIERANYAANSEMAFGTFNDQIRNYQQKIEPLLAELCEFIYDLPTATIALDMDDGDDDHTYTGEEHQIKPSSSKSKITQHSARRRVGVPMFSSDFAVKAQLRSTPWTTLDFLLKMFEFKIIDHDELKKHSINLGGMHEDSATKEKFSWKDFEKQPNNNAAQTHSKNPATGSKSASDLKNTTPNSN